VAIIDSAVELNEKLHPPWGRLAAGAVGLAMFSALFILHPGPARGVIAIGAVMFLWVSLAATRKPVPEPDAELLALVHDRLAGVEEGAAAAMRSTADELRSLRQRIEPGS
jgi:hypothetical protein